MVLILSPYPKQVGVISRRDFSKTFVQEEIIYGIVKLLGVWSGGMLLGVDLQMFDIGAIDEGDYYIKFHLCNKVDEFKWALVVVYGPAQDEHKESFLAELVNMCSHESLPLIIGGDYNILRHLSKKTMIAIILDGLSYSMHRH
jgi:hypothetical protein